MLSKLVSWFRKYRLHSRLKALKSHMSVGNSHFFDSFGVQIIKPVKEKKYLSVGNNSMLDCQITFESGEGEVIIGNGVYIGKSNLICRNKIEIGDHVFIAWGTYLYDHNSHSIDYRERENDINMQLKDYRNGDFFIKNKNWDVVDNNPIKICSNAWIGMNCLILKGVTIGEGAIVGAGSVVTKSVPAWTIVGGNPAVVIKEIPEAIRKQK